MSILNNILKRNGSRNTATAEIDFHNKMTEPVNSNHTAPLIEEDSLLNLDNLNGNIEKASPYSHKAKIIPLMKLGIDHKELVKKIETNLENEGLNLGVHHSGSQEGLESSLRIIYTDYQAEINKLDLEHRDKIIEEIHAFEEQSIKCNNQVRHLKENLIPDKMDDLKEIDAQIDSCGKTSLNTFIDMTNSDNDDMLPIWMMQKRNYKKSLNDFKAQVISLENESEQLSSRIIALNKQLESFSYYSNDLLKNRLETFYNGWLKSYAFIEIDSGTKGECS